MSPLYFGLSAAGTNTAIIVYEPANKPAAPTPQIARPMIRATELGAAPNTFQKSVFWLLSRANGEKGRGKKRTAHHAAQLEKPNRNKIGPF